MYSFGGQLVRNVTYSECKQPKWTDSERPLTNEMFAFQNGFPFKAYLNAYLSISARNEFTVEATFMCVAVNVHRFENASKCTHTHTRTFNVACAVHRHVAIYQNHNQSNRRIAFVP